MMNGCEGRRGGCKDHPCDKQTPGVCSSCLTEKLSKLYNTNPIIYPPSFSPNSPSSPYSSQTTQPFSSSFSSATTTDSSSSRGSSSHNHHHRRRFRRNASHAAEPAVTSCIVTLNLKKSKSLAFASRNRIRERDVTHVSARKKDGFWAKVLKLKKREPLVTT